MWINAWFTKISDPSEAVLTPFMDYFTCLFPCEQLNFKSNKANYCFQNKMAHKKIYKQTNLKKGFKTAPQYFKADYLFWSSMLNNIHTSSIHVQFK